MKKFLLENGTRCVCLLAAIALIVSACDDASIPTSVDDGEAPALSASKAGKAADGQYIVVLKDEYAPGGYAANRAAAADAAQGLGLSPVHTYGSALFGFAATIPEVRLNGLQRDPRVAYVEADGPVSLPTPVKAQAPPWCGDNPSHPACAGEDDGGDDGGQELPWGVDRIDADLNSKTGKGVHVYVIDTGIDADHADLQANIGNGHAVETCKGGQCIAAWDDDHGHGTHVAGTIGAIDNDIDVVGVAPEVILHAVKVLAKSGSGSRSGVIAGIDWVTGEVASNGYGGKAVANMSLGGSGSKSGTCSDNGFTGSDSYHAAICNSAHAGVVYAVAAGNSGADAESFVPAAYDDAVITVSATNANDEWESWSNWGDNPATWTSNVSAPVAIGAPGGNILSTKRNGGTTTMSGTSMASPHVAGSIALYLASGAQNADYSSFENARNGILSGAEDGGTFGHEDESNPHEEDFVDAASL